MHSELERELVELERRLDRRLEELKAGMVQAYSADSEEQAIERENDEVLERIEETVEAELVQVRKALARYRAGEYGICASCGEAIAVERLRAMPFATLCVACAEAEEKAGAAR